MHARAAWIFRTAPCAQAGGLDKLSGNARALKEAVVFAAAAGGATCQRPGAIEGQPTLAEAEALYKESESWYNFW